MATARQPNVLLVEDEPLLRSVSCERMREEGLRVIEAEAAQHAIALLAEHPEIDVVFTDVNMPGPIDGLGLAVEVRRTRPHLHVILTSGLWTGQGKEVPDGIVFLQKPYEIDAVVQLVKTLVKAV